MRSLFTAALLVSTAVPLAAVAQPLAGPVNDAAQPAGDDEEDVRGGGMEPDEGEEIVVTGARIPGEVVSAQPPIQTFNEADIASYGASSIDELLQLIAPQTSSGRGRGGGRPVLLLNGQRISSFREMRAIPPEAIRRMDVLAEEVALRFGYAPDQRVVNVILKPNFASTTVEGELGVPTRGGFVNTEAEANLFRVDGPSRINMEVEVETRGLLTEAERNVRQDPASLPTLATDPDPADYRSLQARGETYTLNGTLARGLGEGGLDGQLTANLAFTHDDSLSLSGIDRVRLTAPGGASALRTFADPLTSRVASDTFEAGLGYNRPMGSWQLSATIDASHADMITRVDRQGDYSALVAAAAAGTLAIDGPLPVLPGAGVDRARQRDLAIGSLVTLAGRPFTLPAGPASLTLKTGYDYARSTGTDTRGLATGGGRTSFDRGDLSAGVNLALPLTSRREGFADALGDFTLNLSGGVNELSDFGTLTDWSAGLTWAPTAKLTFQASYIVNEAAPTLAQLAAPTVTNFNVPIYDFASGQNVLVTTVTGGNSALLSERQRDWKISGTWELPFLQRSNLIVEYFRNRSSDVTRAFPLLTPEIEAAFPGRVVRDASGRLVSIDRRPVTFDEVASSRLRWGLNMSGALGKESEGAGGPGARGGGRGPGMGGGMMRGGPGGPGGGAGRWNLSVYHTWRFTDTVRIAPGTGTLDQLSGDALAAGGVPRHSIELEGGVFKDGVGLRLNGTWNAPATVNGSGLPGSSDLRFGSTFDLDARMFVDLGRKDALVSKVPFLKGSRLSLKVDNLLDQRQRVTDDNGIVPLAYQAAYREPVGRVVSVEFRKMF